MIQLLTPEIIKNDSSRQEQEQRSRVRDLSLEEERLVKSVNSLRAEEKAEKQRIAEELEKGQATLAVRKTVLSQEVSALEARKEEALKPTREIQAQAQKVLEENQAQTLVLNKRLYEVADIKEKVVEQFEKIDDEKQLISEKNEELSRREKGIEAGEAEVKRSAEELAGKWIGYHTAVNTLNTREESLVTRENAVTVGMETNTTFKLSLDSREKDLAERERALVDKYATFISSQKEILTGDLQ